MSLRNRIQLSNIGLLQAFMVKSHENKAQDKHLDTAKRVQILDLTDCISHSTNTLGKGMNPIILPPAMGK